MFIPYEIILKKRNGEALTYEELEHMVMGYVRGEIPDYQMSALLMAIAIRGMTREEAINLTRIMAFSGETLDLSDIPGIKIDKHSTGGVGDSVTLVVVPLVASLGYKVPKLSGRALGHTGGTIDKLESIPGLRVNLSLQEFKDQVRRIGCAVAEATLDLAPADKKLYALRDVTATVDSLPLIASSIMSKKIAAGADVIVLDVKVGSGAFLPDYTSAKELAQIMVEIGKGFNRKIAAVITDMDEPLSPYVGNALEVKGVLNFMREPDEPKFSRFKEVVLSVAGEMVSLASGRSLEEAKEEVYKALKEGKALEKFMEMVEAQGGDISSLKDPSKLPTAKIVHTYVAERDGYVFMNAKELGIISGLLGTARMKKGEPVDYSAGFITFVRKGEKVTKGQPLIELHTNSEDRLREALARLPKGLRVESDESLAQALKRPVVYEVIR